MTTCVEMRSSIACLPPRPHNARTPEAGPKLLDCAAGHVVEGVLLRCGDNEAGGNALEEDAAKKMVVHQFARLRNQVAIEVEPVACRPT